jgi:hypothetical protein
MESKRNPKKTGKTRKIVTILIALVVLAAMLLAAQYLVSSVNVLDLLKKLHGG